MVALMAAVAIMMIMLAAAVPSWRYVMRNDAEEELIFRGGEIADAIARYQKRNGNALPPSLEVLVKGKFLRRPYKDPMTKHGRWRFVRPGEVVGPQGLPASRDHRRHDDDHDHHDHPAVGVLTAGGDARRLPGGGQHQHREEPAHLQRADALQRVGVPARSAAGRGPARRDRRCRARAGRSRRRDRPRPARRPGRSRPFRLRGRWVGRRGVLFRWRGCRPAPRGPRLAAAGRAAAAS